MQASFVLDSNELNSSFINKLKEMFKNKRIELYVTESDDTEYLCASPSNKDILNTSIANIENETNLTTIDTKLFH